MMPVAPFALMCVVCVLGTLGNVFILAALCITRKLRVRANLFILNLAIADLIITGYIMPKNLALSRRWDGANSANNASSASPAFLDPMGAGQNGIADSTELFMSSLESPASSSSSSASSVAYNSDQSSLYSPNDSLLYPPRYIDSTAASQSSRLRVANNSSAHSSELSSASLLSLTSSNFTDGYNNATRYPFSDATCEFDAFLTVVACLVSSQTLLLIAIERYVHICKSQYYSKIFTNVKCSVLILFTWLYCIFWGIAGWTGWTEFKYYADLSICLPSFPLSYSLTLVVFTFCIPAGLLTLTYRNVYRTVKMSRDHVLLSQHNGDVKSEQFKRMKWLPITLTSLVLTYILLWGPACVTVILSSFINIPMSMKLIAIWLVFTNSFANSIWYGFMNTNFQREVKAKLRGLMRKVSQQQPKESSLTHRDLLSEERQSLQERLSTPERLSPSKRVSSSERESPSDRPIRCHVNTDRESVIHNRGTRIDERQNFSVEFHLDSQPSDTGTIAV